MNPRQKQKHAPAAQRLGESLAPQMARVNVYALRLGARLVLDAGHPAFAARGALHDLRAREQMYRLEIHTGRTYSGVRAQRADRLTLHRHLHRHLRLQHDGLRGEKGDLRRRIGWHRCGDLRRGRIGGRDVLRLLVVHERERNRMAWEICVVLTSPVLGFMCAVRRTR